MEKGQIVELRIDDISSEGNGIGRFEGMAIFVQGATYGDVVRAELTQVKKRYAFAKTIEIIEASSDRIEPFCNIDCGGCVFQNLKYETQLMLKEKQVKENLKRLAGIEEPNVLQIIGMENPQTYRNKAQFQVGEKNGKAVVGFYKAKSHSIEECENCNIQTNPAMVLAKTLQQFMEQNGVRAYNRKIDKGLIRNLVVKTAMATGEIMAIVVATNKEIPKIEKLVEMMDDAIYNLPAENGIQYNLESVIINVNKKNDSEIMGDDCITIAGKNTILDESCGMKFEISPLAFYQVNPVQMEKLYGKAIEFADLQGEEILLDLYCGVGTIGLICAKHMEKLVTEKYGQIDYDKLGMVYGVEIIKGAILDANRNAVINGIVNALFKCGAAEKEIDEILKKASEKRLRKNGVTVEEGQEIPMLAPDVVILDPPRAGCAPELLEAVGKVKSEKIVYVSCDPATMARDIAILANYGYKLEKAQPVDMFPHTKSVECVALLVNESSIKL